jgi:PAS domain S-box-containing protein
MTSDEAAGRDSSAADLASLERALHARDQLVEDLRASEERYRVLFERNLAGVLRSTMDGQILECNDAFARILGYASPAEVRARSMTDFYFDPADRAAMLAELRQHGRLPDHEVRCRRKDGSACWVVSSICLVQGEGGQEQIHGTLIDITRQKETEEELRHSQALYHSLVQTVPMSIFRKDLEGRFTFANQRFADSVGRTPAQVVGLTDFDFYPRELAEKYQRDDRRVITNGHVFETIEAHHDPDRPPTYVQVLKAPVRNNQGEVVGTQGIYWDVTARKRAELELERTAAELARSNEALEQFACVASHDLEEPLRTISSYCQLLRSRYRGKLDATADEYLASVVDGVTRMEELICDLLAYSRIGSSGQPFTRTPSEASLERVLANLALAIQETGARITHDPLPIVHADDCQLVQLFQNLISNALKFRGAGPPRVHVAAEPRGAVWLFSVRDNGIGIEPQHFEKIFGVFERLHPPADYPGTGIGLAICRRIAQRHGGRLWVESQPGKGSVFFFTLPLRGE